MNGFLPAGKLSLWSPQPYYIATPRCQNWSVGGAEREGEKRAEVDELAAGEELPLFLPTPSFIAPADDEG